MGQPAKHKDDFLHKILQFKKYYGNIVQWVKMLKRPYAQPCRQTAGYWSGCGKTEAVFNRV